MSFAYKIAPFAAAAFIASSASAFAQAGGPDVPSDAKKQGTMENGSSSTGMKKGGAMQKSAPTTGEKGTATGGNAGGPAGRN